MSLLNGPIARSMTVIALSAAFSATAEQATTQGHRATLASLSARVNLTSVALSPDGSSVAVAASRPNYADNHYESSLVFIDVANGKEHVLSAPGPTANSPQWSPSGERIAWLEASDDNKFNIYVLSVSPPAIQPVRIVTANNAVQAVGSASMPAYAWSPDGEGIAFIAADPPPERFGDEAHNVAFEVTDNNYLATAPAVPARLWWVSSAGGEPRQLTSGTESVKGLGWWRNGRSIVYASQARPADGEFMRASAANIQLKAIDLDSGKVQVIVAAPANIVSEPKSLPGSDLIAYLRYRGPEPWLRSRDIAIASTETGKSRFVTTALDRRIDEFAWLADGKGFILSSPDETREALWLQPLSGGARRVDVGSLAGVSHLSVSRSGALAFIGSGAKQPPEVFVMHSLASRPRQLTHFNNAIAALELGNTETIRWRNDGFDETGVLIYPPGFTPGQKVPLVLNIHGGPEGNSTEAFDLFDQIMAARGWAVFKPNYRGSSSQGEAFQSAVVNDLGAGPGRDIMAGIATLKERGIIDATRMAVSGGSYGGYMTAWLIGNYPGWRSAVAASALVFMLDWYNLSCCNVWADPVLKGSPWVNGNVAHYWEQSPLAYAHKARTPTLILAHSGDQMVPVTESYALYHALRDNGVPVKFVVYPTPGHGFGNSDPVHDRDAFRRWIEWIDQHF